jgi:hypothetical protein
MANSCWFPPFFFVIYEISALDCLTNPVVSWALVEPQFLCKGGERYLGGCCSVALPLSQHCNSFDRFSDCLGNCGLDALRKEFFDEVPHSRYRGHNAPQSQVHYHRARSAPPQIRREFKRRAAIEPVIGHSDSSRPTSFTRSPEQGVDRFRCDAQPGK